MKIWTLRSPASLKGVFYIEFTEEEVAVILRQDNDIFVIFVSTFLFLSFPFRVHWGGHM